MICSDDAVSFSQSARYVTEMEMSNVSYRADSYYISLYDILLTATRDLMRSANVTYVALSIVSFIVVTVSGLIYLFSHKTDDGLILPEETVPEPPIRDDIDTDIQIDSQRSLKLLLSDLNYATSKCYEDRHASRCVRLIRLCPYLINVRAGPHGLTPFQRVCYNGHKCLVEYMLTKGANPSLTTHAGENALCMAIYYYIKHPRITELSCLDVLYRSGCSLDPNSRWYKVALKSATRVCNKRLTEWLLAHGQSREFNHNFRSSSVPATFPDKCYSGVKSIHR